MLIDDDVGSPASRPPRGVVLGLGAATALVPLNSTMIAVALRDVADDFGIGRGRAALLVTVYLVAMLVGQPLAGRISDRVGARRAVTVALVGFGVASVASSVAPTFETLVAGRAGQAAFAATLAPGVQSMLRSITPQPSQGWAFGLFGAVIGVGAALGPVLGGVLVAAAGWPAVFVINVPVVAVALVVVVRLRHFDMGSSARARPAIGGGDEPLAFHANRPFVAAFAAQGLSNLTQYALLLVTPVILENRGWADDRIGLALSSMTVGLIVASSAGGRAGDRHGRRRPVLSGLGLSAVAALVLAIGGLQISAVVLVTALALFGLGLGYANPSIMTAGIQAVEESRTGAAAGLLSMSRYIGSIVSSVVLAAIVTDDGAGTRVVLVVAVAGCAGAWLAATALPHRSRGS